MYVRHKATISMMIDFIVCVCSAGWMRTQKGKEMRNAMMDGWMNSWGVLTYVHAVNVQRR